MAAKSGTNKANGTISTFVVVCGIVFSVLVVCLVNKLIESNVNFEENSHDISRSKLESNVAWSTAPVWCFGFAYIIPGFLGLLGAFVKNKGLYITQMVFSIISLLVMGIVFFFAIGAMIAMVVLKPTMDSCYEVAGRCTCPDSESLDYSCSDLNAMYAMAIALLVIIVLAWILVLVICILSGILACSQQTTGMIMVPPTTTVVQLSSVGNHPPHITYMPQAQPHVHDQAQLVHNMEY